MNVNNKHIPGITDITEDQATAEFLFVNSLVSKGEFLPPREGMLSKYFVNMPAAYASRIIIGKDADDAYFIGLDEDMASYLLQLDFTVIVNNEYLAFSVSAINSNFIIRLPVLPEVCNDIALSGGRTPSNALEEETQAAGITSPADDDFFADLEAEAAQAAETEQPEPDDSFASNRIKIHTFYKPYGSDFAFKKSPKSSRYVPLSVAGAMLSVN